MTVTLQNPAPVALKDEVNGVDLGDKRLNKLLGTLVE